MCHPSIEEEALGLAARRSDGRGLDLAGCQPHRLIGRRSHRSCKLVAVTGSNGKTIVKDALVHVLAGKLSSAGSLGSYNSQLGVPLALLRIPEDTEVAVLEAGISAPLASGRHRSGPRPGHDLRAQHHRERR